MSWIIFDWAGNRIILNKKDTWQSFDDAEADLSQFIDDNGWDYEECRGEYYIEEKKS